MTTKKTVKPQRKKSSFVKKKIAIVYRYGTKTAVELSQQLTRWMKGQGCSVFTAPEQQTIPGTIDATTRSLQKMDLVLVLGGDGTYLRAVRHLQGAQVPILGFNLGTMGFLTSSKPEDAIDLVSQALAGEMEKFPRAMLEIELRRERKIRRWQGLNDLVLERGSRSKLITFNLHSGPLFVGEIKADGIICSSPTGSTAYNLAAGGPLLHPEVKAFSVTAISPHSLTSRPLIMPDDQDILLQIVEESSKSSDEITIARLVIDGQFVGEVFASDEVVIRKAERDHWFVKEPSFNYFQLLREKLKFGERL